MRFVSAVVATLLIAAPCFAQSTPPMYQKSSGQTVEGEGVFCPDASKCGGVAKGGPLIATGQVTIGTTSTLLVAQRLGRQKVIVSVGAANACAFGNTGVTSANGFPLQPVAGATLTLDTSAAIYSTCSAATTVSYVEQY